MAGAGVVDIPLASEAASNEQQIASLIEYRAESLATIRSIDEPLGGAATDIATEDVAGEQLACIES